MPSLRVPNGYNSNVIVGIVASLIVMPSRRGTYNRSRSFEVLVCNVVIGARYSESL